MSAIPVIAIFDIGKTNKKLLLFDEHYKIVFEEEKQFEEIKDEDGFPCEDIIAITSWIKNSFNSLTKNEKYDIKAINFSAYGASFVYLDELLNVILPLYNYLKPYPSELKEKFYKEYGGEDYIAKQTASPVLGNLNSGMQLYRLKHENRDAFDKIKYALHLPQYLSFIFTHKLCSEITSIGCHTNLWDFTNNKYHRWVIEEGIVNLFTPIIPSSDHVSFTNNNKNYIAGFGLHDSSAALIPYLISFSEPFILISTGTWNISLNPFNKSELTIDELHQDCLRYLSYKGKPVKASRLFAGFEHEQQIKRLSEHFNTPIDNYKTIKYNPEIMRKLNSGKNKTDINSIKSSAFIKRDLNTFLNYEEAYNQLISDIINLQVYSIDLVLKDSKVKRIFVDGGFSSNKIFMTLLAETYSEIGVYATVVPQASALGAALIIHKHWNKQSIPENLIKLKQYGTK